MVVLCAAQHGTVEATPSVRPPLSLPLPRAIPLCPMVQCMLTTTTVRCIYGLTPLITVAKVRTAAAARRIANRLGGATLDGVGLRTRGCMLARAEAAHIAHGPEECKLLARIPAGAEVDCTEHYPTGISSTREDNLAGGYHGTPPVNEGSAAPSSSAAASRVSVPSHISNLAFADNCVPRLLTTVCICARFRI